jgi:hypothetical protein
MAALAVVPSPAVTAAPLYLIEDRLAALIETAELVSQTKSRSSAPSFRRPSRLPSTSATASASSWRIWSSRSNSQNSKSTG